MSAANRWHGRLERFVPSESRSRRTHIRHIADIINIGILMNRQHGQVREVINRNVVVSLALEQGFNVFLPVYDGGVDFILHRETDGLVRKVQLKSRWTIDRKYVGRDIWIAFPSGGDWYLMPHDEMMRLAGDALTSGSWLKDGSYSRPRLSAALAESCASYRFPRIAQVAAEAAEADG
jgi:hypothetical protein